MHSNISPIQSLARDECATVSVPAGTAPFDRPSQIADKNCTCFKYLGKSIKSRAATKFANKRLFGLTYH